MHRTFPSFGLLLLLLPALVRAEPVFFGGSHTRDELLLCNGRDVTIAGNGNDIRLVGQCGLVFVQGWDQVVSIDKAQVLRINGVNTQVHANQVGSLEVDASGNQVRATLAYSATPAQVRIAGAEHLLDLHFNGPAQVELGGMDHRFDWHGHEPVINASGVRHDISRW